jgi:hypothetical protein
MPSLIRLFPAALLLLATACAGGARTGGDSNGFPTGPAPGAPSIRAVSGDTVYLIEHYIRPERREQFEAFVQEVLWPAFAQASAARPAWQEIGRRVRLLTPVGPAQDGVLVYTFVLDPYIPGESYDIFELLRQAYTEAEAYQQYSRYAETWARDFRARAYVESGEPAPRR